MAELHRVIGWCITVNLDNPGVIEAYAEMDTIGVRTGRRIGDNDLWIAATARASRALLLTTDKDFDHLVPEFLERERIDPRTS